MNESSMAAREALRRAYEHWLAGEDCRWGEPLLDFAAPELAAERFRRRLDAAVSEEEAVRLAWDARRAGVAMDRAGEVIVDAAFRSVRELNPGAGGPRGGGSFYPLFLLLAADAVEGAYPWLERAARLGEELADRLLDTVKLPEAINPEATGNEEASDERDIARVYIENRAADCFLRLYERTAAPVFLIAARKLLEVAASDLRRPDHGYAVLAVWRYCEAFDDGYYDEYARIAAERLMPVSGVRPEVSGDDRLVDAEGQPLPHPLLYVFYGRLVGKDAFLALGYSLAGQAFQSLVRSGAPAERIARWARSSIGAQGSGGVVDLLAPGRFWGGG